jgi:ParB/RepB/Spo0J family partition protein
MAGRPTLLRRLQRAGAPANSGRAALLPAADPEHRRAMLIDGARGEDRTQDMVYLPIREIAHTPAGLNSRLAYDETALAELTASVREHGVLQPVLVRPLARQDATEWSILINGQAWAPPYVLVAGNRRLEAAKRAGLDCIPVVIRVASKDEAFVLNLVENVQRENLSGAERVRAIELLASLREESGEPMSSRHVAELVKKDHSTIAKWLGINRRPELRDAVAEGRVKIGHATILTAAPADALPGLINSASTLSQTELRQQVTALRRDPVARARQAAALNERRVAQALHCLRQVDAVEVDDEGPVRRLLGQVQARLDELLAPAGPAVA